MFNMTSTAILAALATAPFALAGDLCLSAACTLAPPDQGPACGWWQMWSPGVDVCGPGTQELNLGSDLEDYLVNNGPINLDDICGEQVLLTWTDGAPELYMIDVEAGMSWNIKADNIQGSSTVCHYSGTDCGNAGPIFSRWYWPDLPIC
ncbi:hypothetical protein BJY04DRAFT_213325 [Aspergillus karnatakaensis]|uniref:uncharacterized protein n=1 Tax=Aspergillus karnatakaensis TaxID=1810916 RepID=UPI003CCD5C11